MTTIYLLCENDTDHHMAFDVISWHDNEAEAKDEAERLAWDRYTREVARTDRTNYEPIRPDKTEYRKFFVRAVDKAKE